MGKKIELDKEICDKCQELAKEACRENICAGHFRACCIDQCYQISECQRIDCIFRKFSNFQGAEMHCPYLLEHIMKEDEKNAK